jgi:glutathione gamma-glutamylcysteinyltransferase
MECYFPLSEHFLTQSAPPTCGPSTLSMVLNALQLDPQRSWKGIWRWWSEDNLSGINGEMMKKGIDLEEFDRVAKLNYTQFVSFYYSRGEFERGHTIKVFDEVQRVKNFHHRTARYLTF